MQASMLVRIVEIAVAERLVSRVRGSRLEEEKRWKRIRKIGNG